MKTVKETVKSLFFSLVSVSPNSEPESLRCWFSPTGAAALLLLCTLCLFRASLDQKHPVPHSSVLAEQKFGGHQAGAEALLPSVSHLWLWHGLYSSDAPGYGQPQPKQQPGTRVFDPVVQSVACGAITVDGDVPCHPVMVAVVALGTTLWLEGAAGQAGSPTDWVIRVR